MPILAFLKTHKLLLFFVATTVAFAIATIVLAIENAFLRTPPTPASKYRLPRTARPKSYDLYLYPDLKTGLFKGQVSTDVIVEYDTNEIVMHSDQLTINQVLIDGEPGVFESDTVYDFLIVRKSDSSQFLRGTEVNITFTYEGDMKNRLVGLYRSSYVNPDGVRRFLSTTQFEPTDARKAFPCFDQPNLKATYKVHLWRPKDGDYLALSNYPQIGEEETDGGVMVHFQETTVPMSTYLVCFIVADFKHTKTTFNNAGKVIPLRVFANPNQKEKTTYAGEMGKAAIEYFVNYFKIPYLLPKLDMIAIPDFLSGAMENWGLVTYRETALLYNETSHSTSDQKIVAITVAHELAHTLFGNLVTMEWWDELWLNEGFATYLSYKGADVHHPDWEMLDQFPTDILHVVLAFDAGDTTHPIIHEVEAPPQIKKFFDLITYYKGASVLRMLETVVTPAKFHRGLINYLNAHRFGNTVSKNLWDELQAVVGDEVNVEGFMNTFIVQMGVPIIQARVKGNKYTFTQKRFVKDNKTLKNQSSSPLNYKWTIPIMYVTDLGRSEEIHWFKHDADELTIEKPAGAKWIKFNPNQECYYRVNYEEKDWKLLTENFKILPILDRTHLLEECFSIAESGQLNYDIALNLSQYLVGEMFYTPWNVARRQFTSMSRYLQTSKYHSKFKDYVIKLLKPTYDQLGWDGSEDDPHLTKLNRVQILNLACLMDYDVALNEVKNRFKTWIDDGTTKVSPDLHDLIYTFGMETADEATWNKVYDMFSKETDPSEKGKLMNGLAHVQNPKLLTKLIDLAKNESYISRQDYFTLLKDISINPIGTPIVWNYVRSNWPYLVDRFTLDNPYLGQLVPGITNRFSTNLKVEEMKRFFEKYPEAGAGADLRREALDTVSNNIKWLDKYKAVVEDWIRKLE